MVSDWLTTESGLKVFIEEFNHRVVVESPEGDITPVGKLGAGAGEFHYPRGAVELASRLYVVDSWNHRIEAFLLPEMKYAFSFGGLQHLHCPSAITAIDIDDHKCLVVADTNNARLVFYEPSGNFAFASDLEGFPVKLRWRESVLHVQYEDGAWESVLY